MGGRAGTGDIVSEGNGIPAMASEFKKRSLRPFPTKIFYDSMT